MNGGGLPIHRSTERIGGAEHLGLLGEANGEAVEQVPDLLAEVADDDRDLVHARRLELLEQRHDHGLPVDREDRLRPALGQRAKAATFACGQDDRVHLARAEAQRPQGDDHAAAR